MSRRLVLYSDQIEPTTDPIDDLLFAMLPSSGATIGYVPSSPDPDRTWFRSRMAGYAKRGARLTFFGLETEFDPMALGDGHGHGASMLRQSASRWLGIRRREP